jgi:hypothetical protein
MLRWEYSHLSERSERSRERLVMQHPVMKRGFSVEAPISEMNLLKVSFAFTIILGESLLTQSFGGDLQIYKMVVQSHTIGSTGSTT